MHSPIRSKSIHLRVSPFEHKRLQACANALLISLSDFLRQAPIIAFESRHARYNWYNAFQRAVSRRKDRP